jgi:hypothetical protein
LFQSNFIDSQPDDDTEFFLLVTLDPDTFRLALEDWEIWRRWETAFYCGAATQATHPALPADRERHEEITRSLQGRLCVDPQSATRAKGDFRRRNDPGWNGRGMEPLEVRWSIVERPVDVTLQPFSGSGS